MNYNYDLHKVMQYTPIAWSAAAHKYSSPGLSHVALMEFALMAGMAGDIHTEVSHMDRLKNGVNSIANNKLVDKLIEGQLIAIYKEAKNTRIGYRPARYLITEKGKKLYYNMRRHATEILPKLITDAGDVRLAEQLNDIQGLFDRMERTR